METIATFILMSVVIIALLTKSFIDSAIIREAEAKNRNLIIKIGDLEDRMIKYQENSVKIIDDHSKMVNNILKITEEDSDN